MSRSVTFVVARQALLGVTLTVIVWAGGCRQEVAPLAPSPATNRTASNGAVAATNKPSRTDPAKSLSNDSADQAKEVATAKTQDSEAAARADESAARENPNGTAITTDAEQAKKPSSVGSEGASRSEKPTHDTPPARPRPTARRPAIPGQPLEISFDDLVIGMQADIVFRPWMLSDRAKEIDGQVVKVVGYLHGGVDEFDKLTGEVVVLRNKECKFGPGGQADHLVRVFLRKGVKARFTDNAIEITGTLKVNPWQGPDGNTWSLYDIDATAFKDLNRR